MGKLLLKNANIIDMKNKNNAIKDVLIEDHEIQKILNCGEMNCSNTIDLGGKTLIPGFIDSHVHLVQTIIDEFSVNLEDAKNIDEVLQKISDKRKNNPTIDMILGTRLSEFSLEDNKLPTKEDLDKVAPDIPVFLSSVEFHTITVNSFALHKLNLPLSIDKIEKKNGLPTGRMINEASILARKKMYEMLSVNQQLDDLEKVQDKIIQQGVTSLIAIEGGYLFHNKHVDFLLKNMDRFKIDVSIFFSTTDTKKVKAYNFNKIGGDIFLDGSFASQNAAISEPYNDSENEKGKLFFTEQEIDDFIENSIKENLQVSIHAVGDIGIEKVLDSYERILKKYPNSNLRHKIEHFELPKQEHIVRARDLNLILTMHPTYEYFFREKGGMYDRRLGQKRSLKTNPFRQIFDEGIIVAGGSDSNVMPVNPLLGIHSAVNHPNEDSRITPYEALKMFTINGYYGNFEEEVKGTIEPGKLADLVVLSNNPLECEKNSIKDIKVLYTIKNGEIIYKSGE